MEYIIFLALAFIEFIFMIFVTKELDHIKEYVSIQYSSFEFASTEDKPNGLNVLIKILVPVIYIIIVSGIFYEMNQGWLVKNIYLVTIFYYIIKWINIIFILKRKDLHDWKTDIILSIIGTIISIAIYYIFIIRTNQIFVSLEEIRDGVWVSIIIFIFVIIKNNIYNNMKTNHREQERRKYNYIKKKYLYFKDKYGDIIKTRNKRLANITYSILLYENYNRPFIYRIIEYIKFIFTRHATLGIMQVNSRTLISNRTSVKKGYKIIKNEYYRLRKIYKKKNIPLDDWFVADVINQYNNGRKYCSEISYIMTMIDKINNTGLI